MRKITPVLESELPELPSGWRWSPSPQGYPMAINLSGTTAAWVDSGRVVISSGDTSCSKSAPVDVVSAVLAEYNGRLDP